MKCETCKMKRVCNELERMGKVPKHENCRCYSPEKPVTNADKLRSMSDEELAKLFGQIENGARNDDQLGSDGWLDWLKQEVTDG